MVGFHSELCCCVVVCLVFVVCRFVFLLVVVYSFCFVVMCVVFCLFCLFLLFVVLVFVFCCVFVAVPIACDVIFMSCPRVACIALIIVDFIGSEAWSRGILQVSPSHRFTMVRLWLGMLQRLPARIARVRCDHRHR